MIFHDPDLPGDQLFNIPQILLLNRITKGNGCSVCSCSCGSADPMHIRFGNVWYLIIDNILKIIYVDAACRYICRNKYTGCLSLKI